MGIATESTTQYRIVAWVNAVIDLFSMKRWSTLMLMAISVL